jgi:hypothetical protein
LERYQALVLAYVSFARDHYGLWRLMLGPYGRDPEAPKLARPSTYDWLGKVLAELKSFGQINSAAPEDQYFIWTAIHRFSDLQTSPAATRAPAQHATRTHALKPLKALGFIATDGVSINVINGASPTQSQLSQRN